MEVEDLVDVSNETVESLLQLTRAELVHLCQQRRLPYSGTKAQLAERLVAHELTSRDPQRFSWRLIEMLVSGACAKRVHEGWV